MAAVAIVLDGSSLSLPDVVRAAHGEGVAPDPDALSRVRDTQRAADAVALTREVYGRSTGVGANRTVVIDPAAIDTGMALLRSHAVSAGPPRSRERVRATVVVRANQLLAAGSGASGELVEGLFALLADDDLPPVREFGGVGTGDLGALATVGLALARRGVWIGAGDALPLMSSNAATLADAALAVHALAALSEAALEVAAATFVVVDGNAEAFALPVERATPFAGARQVARTMRTLTAGRSTPVRIQDPFALRTLPQVHGAWVDSLTRAADVVDQLVNAPTENPLFLAGADVAHHGGFHGAPLTAALDTVRLTAIGAMRLSRARLTALCEPALTTLTPFLGDPARLGASGVIGLEYVAGSALGDLHMLAHPAATTSVVVSRGLEEDASFASMAARAALQAVAACRTVVAAELLTALRALGMRGRPVPERFAELAAELDHELDDRDLTDDLDRVVAALGG